MRYPQPIGLLVARTAKAASRAFDDDLAAAGGSQPVWLILLELIRGGHRTQSELAAAVGIQGPTLTHHLATMERDGLVSRERTGRIQRVALTDAGRALFHRLRAGAMAHDERLRAGFTETELHELRGYLQRLAANLD